ncbi:hypothetical protein [Actinomadura sp. NPDC000929]|uniref:hypothetical protein n=1 Tax=Actinomadura sp. NPDC000929 TaxID=3154517 RepID=UPI003392C9AC
MHKRARTALTTTAFGTGGAIFGVLVAALTLGVWAADPTAAFTVPGAWYPILTGAIAGFAGGIIGGLAGGRMGRDSAVSILALCGGFGLMVTFLETINDRILYYYIVDFGVVLLTIGISTMIANRIAAERRR